MVLGTSNGAGKSRLATALCRHYAARGFKVAPFKAQNMSNNGAAIAMADGSVGEISAAQVLLAAPELGACAWRARIACFVLRRRLRRPGGRRGIRVYPRHPGETDPMTCTHTARAAVLAALRARGRKLRDCTSFGIPRTVLRIAVAAPAQQDQLLADWHAEVDI